MPSNEEILNYVMNTPNNTNPAVLRDMLNNNSDGGNPGYDVETVTVDVIPEQTVTPTAEQDGGAKYAELALAEDVTEAPDFLHVVLNGDEYDLTRTQVSGGVTYTLEDESASIFIGLNPNTGALGSALSVNDSYPETVTIHATSTETDVTVTDDFKKAVAEAGGGTAVLAVRISSGGGGEKVMDKTWQEIADSDFAVCYNTPALGGKYFAYITRATSSELGYHVMVVAWNDSSNAFASQVFYTDSPDGYPHVGKA